MTGLTGSISDVPPAGPSVSSGASISDIQALISASQTSYNTALQAFTTANTAYNNAKDTADADYTAYTQNPSPQALLQFEADVAQYDTALATLQTTLTALNTASTQYVTDLAYEQIYYTQQGDTTVANQIAAIIAATPTSGQWPTELPTLPYLSSTEQTTLTGESSQISAAQTGLLTAFLDYRNIVWKVSTDGITATSQTGEVTAAQYNLDLANAGVAGYDISTCQAAYNAASSTLQATTTQLTTDEGLVAGFRSTLSSQLTAYQTLMTSIEALGATGPTDPTVASIVAFCANWNTNVVQPVQAALTAALGAEESNFATADQAAVAAFYAQFQSSNPQFSTAYLQGIVSSFTSIQSALSAAGLIQGPAISFPALPSASSSMSMSELMGVIGDVEVMTQSLIQQAATSDSSVNALRLQFAINHLRLYANELSVLQSWANKLAAAETNYNTTIQAQNAATYSQFVTIYNTYASNISTINSSVIPPINTQIASENAAGQALVDASNAIDDGVINAIYYTQSSQTETPNYLISFLPGVSEGSPTIPTPVVFTPIPSFPPLSGTPLPTLPNQTYPASGISPADVASINATVTSFLTQIAPYKDLVESTLGSSLGPLLLNSTIPVTAIQDQTSMLQKNFTLLYAFVTQTVLSAINAEVQTDETSKLKAQYTALLNSLTSSSTSGGSVGLGTSIIQSAGRLDAILDSIANSSIFSRTIQDIFTRAAMLAGLSVAGTVPQILRQLSNKHITLAGLLESEAQKSGQEVEAQTLTDLTNAVMQQLALIASVPGPLQQNAISMLQSLPSLSSLSNEDLVKLISGIVTMQQQTLLSLTAMLGVNQGLSPGQFATQVFGSAGASTADMVSRFEGLGIPATRAQELAAVASGNDELETTLSSLGFDQNTRTILMALVASAQGNIPLSSGAPGGPAFLDTLLTALKANGITVTSDVNSPEFLEQLASQLGAKATTQQQSVINNALLGTPGVASPPLTSGSFVTQFQQAAAETESQIAAIFSSPATPSGGATQAPPAVTPTSILSSLTTQFETLSPAIQSTLIAQAANTPSLAAVTGVTNEQKAALMLGLRLGVISAPEATSLMNLASLQSQMQAQGLAFTISNIQTAVISKLFTPTPDELEQIKEARLRDISAPYKTPTTLPPQVLDQVSVAFRTYFNNLADQKTAATAYETFAKTIQRLSDFNHVAINYLLDPAKIILRQFSIVTRTAQDRIQQPKIALSG